MGSFCFQRHSVAKPKHTDMKEVTQNSKRSTNFQILFYVQLTVSISIGHGYTQLAHSF